MYKKRASFLILLLYALQCDAWSFWGTTPQPQIPLAPMTRFTLMIDPAGDARDPGREIGDGFERESTLYCAAEIKRSLEAQVPGIRVILTRFAEEAHALEDSTEALQNAAFANRLNANLYVSLCFYETHEKTAQLYFYYTLYDPATDLWAKKGMELALLPFDQAYKLSIKQTQRYIQSLYEVMAQDARSAGIACHKPIGLPLRPLAGITAPALMIELGIKKKDDWKQAVPLLVKGLETVINANVSHALSP